MGTQEYDEIKRIAKLMDIKSECLRLACGNSAGLLTEKIIETAEKFYQFIIKN